jgi:ribosomal protein S18 acetylase RimI-like enzyme
MTPLIELTEQPDPRARETILALIRQYNDARLGDTARGLVAVLVRDPDTRDVVGGLWGRISRGKLYVENLGLPEDLRGAGLGARLMRMAEENAAARGCNGAFLDTFSPRARGFYESQGYQVFGRIDDHPPGHSRWFLHKTF